MRRVVSAGVVALDGRSILLIQHEGGYGFPKGRVEPGETEEQAALREGPEETGLDMQLIKRIGDTITRPSVIYPDGYYPGAPSEPVLKDIVLFLARVLGPSEIPHEESSTPVWVDLDVAATGMKHPQDTQFIVQTVIPLVQGMSGPEGPQV